MIMADGRRMMRIYDNLMNNICKYAQPGTRVYLTLEVNNGQAVTTFKNTSSAELNISADELVERFVRGDQSRNTEGNGLGLSIAKSMTELQGGKFDITIDGDLFKVTLTFPVIV
jgi:signal transduction histidine kinase